MEQVGQDGSAGDCGGEVHSASMESRECLWYFLQVSSYLHWGCREKWCLPVLLFLEKSPKDPLPSFMCSEISKLISFMCTPGTFPLLFLYCIFVEMFDMLAL